MKKILIFFIIFILNADELNHKQEKDNNVTSIEKSLVEQKKPKPKKNKSKDLNTSVFISADAIIPFKYDENETKFMDIDKLLENKDEDNIMKIKKFEYTINPEFNTDTKNIDIQNKEINWQDILKEDVGIRLQIDKKF